MQPIFLWLQRLLSGLSSTRRKVLTNVAWALTGKVVSMGGVLLVGILVGRYLGPKQYGLMNYVISYVALFEILAAFGLENIEIRELARHPEARNGILGTCFSLRLLFAFVAYAAMAVVLGFFESDIFTIKLILAYALHLFVMPFKVAQNYFTSILQNEYVIKSQIFRTVLGAGIKMVLLWMKAPVEWFILAAAFDFVLLTGGYATSYQRHAGRLRDWRFERARVPYLLREAFPLLLSGAAIIVYQRIDQVIIKKMLDVEQVGYFATAGMFLGVVLFLPSILGQTLTPVLVRLRETNTALYECKKRQVMGLMVWGSILLSAAVCAVSPWLIRGTYGVAYMAAVPVLQIMIWKTVGMALAAGSGQLIIIEGIQKWVVIRNLIGCVLCIGLNFLLIPRFGILGSAWATLATVLGAGMLAHTLIPAYHAIFRVQVRALMLGWLDLFTVFRHRGPRTESAVDGDAQHGLEGRGRSAPRLPSPRRCAACLACVDACPCRALVAEEDAGGFMQIRRDASKCVRCGKCERVCPVLRCEMHGSNRPEDAPTPYMAWATDDALRERSSSGGIFGTLARAVLAMGGAVAGARVEGTRIRHVLIDREEDLEPLQKSKYMWSDTRGIYADVRERLKNGQRVLFSGTPCQVAGLLASVSSAERANLLAVDFVCHGMPSRKIWDLFAAKLPTSITRIISFRDKQDGWRNSYALSVETEDGRVHRMTGSADAYTRMFLSDFALRPACYACPFAGVHRVADVTLADARGVSQNAPEEHGGVSLVLCHTAVGRCAVEAAGVHCKLTEWQPQLQANPRVAFGTTLRRYHPARWFLHHPCGLTAALQRRIFENRFRGYPLWTLFVFPLAIATYLLSRLELRRRARWSRALDRAIRATSGRSTP